MKYENLISTHGLPEGWFYDEDIKEYRRLVESIPDYSHICELGCYKGRSICSIADIILRKKLKVSVVDLFTGTENEMTEEQKKNKIDYRPEFTANVKKFGLDNIDIITCDTKKAHPAFDDETFHLIFIDADHSYEGVKGDIELWLPKLRKYGIICGHDYNSFEGVNKAVDEAFKKVIVGGSVWSKKQNSVLCSISTKNRYTDYLPMAIMSVINQSWKPDALIIYDDNDIDKRKDLREISSYKHLFQLLDTNNIKWSVQFGEGKGQSHNHERANHEGYTYVWRLDDDTVAEPNVLRELIAEVTKEGVGAVGCSVLPTVCDYRKVDSSSQIDKLYKPNKQWFHISKVEEVDHLHCSFVYRAGIVNYDLRLSKKCHREETMFTYSLKLKGYKILIVPGIVWHLRAEGGIRSDDNVKDYEHDEHLFRKWLEFKKSGKKLYVLAGGIGDDYMFLQAIKPEKDSIIACCKPEVFSGFNTISIAEANELVDIKDYDIYKWCSDHKWGGHLVDAYKELYKELYE